MRIRKHAKLSPLLYTSSSLPLLQTTICQLNQSPWDVVTFSPEEYPPPTITPPPPPPPLYHQVEEEDSYLVNGSLCDSIGALEREMKEYDKPKWGDSNGDVVVEATGGGYVDINMEDPPLEKVGNLVEEKEIFCSKIDFKGWQCHRIAKSGHSFCEHHLLSRLSKNNNGSTNLARENSFVESAKSTENHSRGRPKKASASDDPNDYYYYSGFGPRWGGKRRGDQLTSTSSTNNNSKYFNNDNNVSHFEISNVEGGELLGSTRIEYGELDYMVEEDDEEKDGGSLKKRARKPVKARSLKSLM